MVRCAAAGCCGANPCFVIQDLILTGSHTELERAYRLTFSLVSSTNEFPQYFVGYFNASPHKNQSVAGFKRRRPTPYDEA